MSRLTAIARRERRSRDDVVRDTFEGDGAARAYLTSHERPAYLAHHLASRMDAVTSLMAGWPGGALLDVGCGPGVFVSRLAREAAPASAIVALDRSEAMVAECRRAGGPAGAVRAEVGTVDAMPFEDGAFGLVLAMGLLEYVDVGPALHEIARVMRPGGLALLTMPNPLSPYRIVERFLFHPFFRLWGFGERLLKVPPGHRHGLGRRVVRACSERRLRRVAAAAGLRAGEAVYHDFNLFVPPLDRLAPEAAAGAARRLEGLGRGPLRWLGTGYVLVARKPVPRGRPGPAPGSAP